MWRTVVIVLLAGLLVGSTAANVALLRQTSSASDEVARQRNRVASAAATQASLQTTVEALSSQVERMQTATPRPTTDSTYLGGGTSAATAQIEQIERQVENLRGLTRARDIPVQLRDGSSLARYIEQTYARDNPPSERAIDQKLLVALGALRADQDLFEISRGLAQDQVLAWYSTSDKTLYVVANPDAPLRPEVQTAVAREYVHALQDQNFDLSRLQPVHADNQDQAIALRALLEGDALLVQRAWSQQNLNETTLDNLPDPDSTSFDLAPAIIQANIRFVARAGLQFAQQLYIRAGSFDGINAAYANAPPRSTAQVLEAQKYFARAAPVDVVMPDVAAKLGNGWTRVASNVLGQFELFNVVAEGSDSATASHAAAGWAGDRWQLLENNGRTALVLRTAWTSEETAQTFFATYAAALKVRFPAARVDSDTPIRLALTDPSGSVELRLSGSEVLFALAADRASVEALVTAIGGF